VTFIARRENPPHAVLRFDAALIVRQAHDAIEGLSFSLEEWLEERDQDFDEFENLDQPARDDAFYAIGRLQGAAEACGLTIRELVDLASEAS
jgi:hypothetical protein